MADSLRGCIDAHPAPFIVPPRHRSPRTRLGEVRGAASSSLFLRKNPSLFCLLTRLPPDAATPATRGAAGGGRRARRMRRLRHGSRSSRGTCIFNEFQAILNMDAATRYRATSYDVVVFRSRRRFGRRARRLDYGKGVQGGWAAAAVGLLQTPYGRPLPRFRGLFITC